MNIIDLIVIISLAVFYILFFGKTILLYRNGIKVWIIGTKTKKPSEILLSSLLLLSFIFIIITSLHIQLPIIISKFLINIIWIKYIGIIFCITSLVIFLLALISFGKAWRIGIDETNSNELITSGIFKYSRNPVFLFMDLYSIGIMLIYPNIIFIIIMICTIFCIHIQILQEEKFLINKFSNKYIEYMKKTRRYI